jgi:hypothetical protein
MDLGGAWRTAEDFLRRHLKTKAVRAAEQRRKTRRSQAAWHTTQRLAAFGAVPAAGAFTVATSAAALSGVVAAAAAGGAALVGLGAARLWSLARAGEHFSREELTALPGATEDWLLDRRELLPRGAEATLDTLLVHLGDLPPHLARLNPNETLAWEARRLLGDHLPGLVDPWCNLPAVTRNSDAEARRRFVAGLETLAGEVRRLTEEVSRDERMRLEARSRFVETRYRDPDTGV